MSSRAEDDLGDPAAIADVGLLSPVVAGTAVEPLTGDAAVTAAMVRAEAALLRALARTGVAPAEAGTLADAVGAVQPDPRELAVRATDGGNPVIPLVRALRSAVPDEHAAWVHHGATSQDMLDTALMLVSRDTLRLVEHELTRLGRALAALADAHRSTPAVGRTLTQQAMPTTFGVRVAGWLAGVHDAVRMVRVHAGLPVSLGGPVGTAAAYGEHGPAVVDAFADELGLRAPVAPWHVRRTPMLGVATPLTGVGESCGKLAADVLVMAQSEVGEVREGVDGPSSAMAHKANPTQSVLIVAAARQLPALLSTVAAAGVAEQERPAGAWHAEWQPLRTMLRLAGGASERATALVDALVVDTDAMARNLDQLVATAGRDRSWVDEQTRHAGVWIDRVLAQHEGVFA